MSTSVPQPTITELNTAEAAQQALEGVEYIMLDIDGVIWTGDKIIAQVPETLQWLEKVKGLKLRFLTNNSTTTRKAVAQKFAAKGIEGVSVENVYSSGFVAALHLKSLAAAKEQSKEGGERENEEEPKFTENVFVCGEKGLHEELRTIALAKGATTYGHEIVPRSNDDFLRLLKPTGLLRALDEPLLPATSDPLRDPDATITERVSLKDMRIGAIVAGLDSYNNSLKLGVAGLAEQLAQRGEVPTTPGHRHQIPFIVTNEDPQLPAEGGWSIPGAGTIVTALSTLMNRGPDIVCGKPHTNMAELLFANEGIKDPRKCLMIGDRLSTDIAFGRAAGCRTLFVLSGCEGRDHVTSAPSTEWLPEYIGNSLADLLLAK